MRRGYLPCVLERRQLFELCWIAQVGLLVCCLLDRLVGVVSMCMRVTESSCVAYTYDKVAFCDVFFVFVCC